MKTVWIKYGRWASVQKDKFKYVDFTINNLRELLKILNNDKNTRKIRN